MGNVEIEIYMTNFVGFFKKNPDQLKILIGDFDGEKFYDKVRGLATKNHEEEKEVAPTRQQMIDIVLELKIPELFEKPNPKAVVEGYVQKTKWGKIILN